MKTALLVAILTVSLVEAPAFAGDKPEKKADDVICRTDAEIGSRLNRKRICMTRAQWEDQRRENKNSIDKIQNTRMVTN